VGIFVFWGSFKFKFVKIGPLNFIFFAKRGQVIRVEDDIIGEVVLHPAGFFFFFPKVKS